MLKTPTDAFAKDILKRVKEHEQNPIWKQWGFASEKEFLKRYPTYKGMRSETMETVEIAIPNEIADRINTR